MSNLKNVRAELEKIKKEMAAKEAELKREEARPVIELINNELLNSEDVQEKFIHMDMCIDPGSLLHIQKGFYIRILAVCHYTDKYVCLDDLAGIGIDDHGRISCPVNFDLFAGFAVDMHCCTMFLLIRPLSKCIYIKKMYAYILKEIWQRFPLPE